MPNPARRAIHDYLEEDEVEMPGGGQMPIDRLAERGVMSESLMRKARPEVYAAEHGGMSPAQVDQIAAMARQPNEDFLASPGGPREDEVELPGGGQASFDDLEMTGGMTDALRRKAQPSVVEIEITQTPIARAQGRLQRMLGATEDRARDARRERYDAAQVRRIRAEDPDFGKGQGAIIRNSSLPQPADFAEEEAAAAERARIQEQIEREQLTAAAPEESAARAERLRVEAEARSDPRTRIRRMLGR